MRLLFIVAVLCAQGLASQWIYYPAAYSTYGDKTDDVSLEEQMCLLTVSKNDRQFYTAVYMRDRLDGGEWAYTQHAGLVTATWPVDHWFVSVAGAAVNGRLKNVPDEFAPLNHGYLVAAKLTNFEYPLWWGLLADSYDEPQGIHVRHVGLQGDLRICEKIWAASSAQMTMDEGSSLLYNATLSANIGITRKLQFGSDVMVGKTALPFSWTTLVLNNTPAQIKGMWGFKGSVHASRIVTFHTGYRHIAYVNAKADYGFVGLGLRIVR